MKAKTSYYCHHIELIVERLEAEQREVKSSIEIVAKVSRMRLYSEVAEKVGQVDLYASNLLVFLEDSEVEAVAEHIEVAKKLDSQNSEVQNLEVLNS